MALERVLHLRITSVRARLFAATLLTAAAQPARATTPTTANMWGGLPMALDVGGTIALFVPPIVLITFTAASVLSKRNNAGRPGAVQSSGPLNKTLHHALKGVLYRRHETSEKTRETPSAKAAEIAHITNPFLGMLRQMEDRLAAIAGLIGAASGALTAMSRGSLPGAQGWPRGASIHASSFDHSAGDDPRIAAAIRTESAFILGAAQSLEASIGDAAEAINQLAELISAAATSAVSAADLSTRVADVVQVAAVSLTRLDDAARRITEITTFIDKVALQTQGTTAITLASVANIIGSAAQAHQSIDAASGLIAKLHDAMRVMSYEDVGNPLQQIVNIDTPLVGAKDLADHLAQSLAVMQQQGSTTADSAAAFSEQGCLPTAQGCRGTGDVRPLDRLPSAFG